MRVDLHTHTFRSFDAFSTDAELLKACEIRKINVLGMTEHDVGTLVPSNLSIPSNLVLVTGCEFTTEEGVHIIGLGVDPEKLKKKSKKDILNFINDSEGLAIMPHPLRPGSGYLTVYGVDKDISKFKALELINGGKIHFNQVKELLVICKKFNLLGIGSSDSHKVDQIGNVFTDIDIKINCKNQMQFIRKFKSLKQKDVRIFYNEILKENSARDLNVVQRLKTYQTLTKYVPKIFKRSIKVLFYKGSRINLHEPKYKELLITQP